MATKVLILGGTTEASALARGLAGDARFDATLSLAGRTANPAAAPIPTRIGGFGGAAGLATYLREHAIDRLVDATHPFAAVISANAVTAAAEAGIPLLAVERPPWRPESGDTWTPVPDTESAVAALGAAPRRVFLAVGRLSLPAFRAAPHHHYLIRLIERPEGELGLPDAEIVQARGPFALADELALLESRGVEILVTKNAGGSATAPKLEAARRLGVGVVMIGRPAIPPRPAVATAEAALDWLRRDHGEGARRGV